MRPIPKSLLPHTVILHKRSEEDRWGEETLDMGKKVRFVRLEPSTQIIRDRSNVEIQLSAILFYDCKNSNPANITFSADDIVVFNGVRHQIKVVEPLYDKNKLHHYELGLIRYA